MSSGHMCKCGAAMQYDFGGKPYCSKCEGMGARIMAAFKSLFSIEAHEERMGRIASETRDELRRKST